MKATNIAYPKSTQTFLFHFHKYEDRSCRERETVKVRLLALRDKVARLAEEHASVYFLLFMVGAPLLILATVFLFTMVSSLFFLAASLVF